MPSQSDSSAGFSEALQQLRQLGEEKFSGSFRAEQEQVVKVLYLSNGRLACASSTHPADRLGTLLASEQRITDAQLETAQDRALPGEALGSVLVNLGYIGPEDLLWGARRQVEGVLASILTWTEGAFRSRSGPLPERAVNLELALGPTLVAAMRHVPDDQTIERLIGPADQRLKAQNVGFREELDEQTVAILELLDGSRDIAEVTADAPLGAGQAVRVILGLKALDLLEVVESQEERTLADAFPDAEPSGVDSDDHNVFEDFPAPRETRASVDTAHSFGDRESAESAEEMPAPAEDGIDEETAVDPGKEMPPRETAAAAVETTADSAAAEAADEEEEEEAEEEELQDAPDLEQRRDDAVASEPGDLPFADEVPLERHLDVEEAEDDETERWDNPPEDEEGPDEPEGPSWSPPPGGERARPLVLRGWMIGAALPVLALLLVFIFSGDDKPPALNTSPPAPPESEQAAGTVDPRLTPGVAGTGEGASTTPPVSGRSSRAQPTKPAQARRTIAADPAPLPESLAKPGSGATLIKVGYPAGSEAFAAGEFSRAADFWQAWRATQPEGAYTLQVMVACKNDTLLQIRDRIAAPDRLFLAPVQVGATPCYKVLWGSYRSRVEAEAALSRVPAYFTSGGDHPWPVAFSSLSR